MCNKLKLLGTDIQIKLDVESYIIVLGVVTANEVLRIPEGVEILDLGIRKIGVQSVKELYLPESLMKLREFKFNDIFPNLEKVIFHEKSKVDLTESLFEDLVSLTEVVLPLSIKTIPFSCFSNSGIRKINIPRTVTSIRKYAFPHTKLEDLTLHEGISEIWYSAFLNTNIEKLVLPSSLNILGQNIFLGCHKLKEVIILEGLEGIPDNTFAHCSNLEKVSIASTITAIRQSVFKGCNIKELELKGFLDLATETVHIQGSTFLTNIEKVVLHDSRMEEEIKKWTFGKSVEVITPTSTYILH